MFFGVASCLKTSQNMTGTSRWEAALCDSAESPAPAFSQGLAPGPRSPQPVHLSIRVLFPLSPRLH